MNKLGLHIIGGTSVALGRPTIVKLVNASPEYVRQVRAEVGPDCLIVVRWFEGVQALSSPEGNAADWVGRHRLDLLALSGDPNVVVEGYNEIPYELAVRFARFEVQRIRILHDLGLRAGVGSWSVGCPDVEAWCQYQPVLNIMGPQDVVCLHEYWADGDDLGNPWHVCRFALPGVWERLASLQIAVTECGRDAVEGQGQPGWQRTTDPQTYLAELRRYAEMLAQYPNVVGATVFQVGSSDSRWAPFEMTAIWPQVIAEYSAESPPVTAVPPAEESTHVTFDQYDGRCYTPDEYREYVAQSGVQVDRVIVHHTAIPTLDSWQGESTMLAMKRYYETFKGWTCGPHAFVAPEGIWVMAPLGTPNLGAGWVSKTDINVEIVGDYTDRLPSGDVLANAVSAVTTLLLAGGHGVEALSKHNDYASTQCPGNALTASWGWFVGLVQAEIVARTAPVRLPLPEDETASDPASLADKARWWHEEMARQIEAGNGDRARSILMSLIRLIYRLERALKEMA